MNRREALKRLGLSFGALVTLPATTTFLQGCSTQSSSAEWEPLFFSPENGHVLKHMVDIIIPAGNGTPSASEVGVSEFIDQFIQEVVSLQEQEQIKAYFSNITTQLRQEAGKDNILELEESDIEPMIDRSLNKSEEEKQKILEKIDTYVQSKQNGNSPELFNDVASYALITNIRDLTIWGYKSSQKVGEEILRYDAIPGEQKGCVSVEEATGGRAWSL